MVRPIVLVFQEFAEVTVTPTTPDLNCLVVGPAYQIRDYPKDSATIAVSDYGALHEDSPVVTPPAMTPAITLAAAPDLEAGAWVDPTSIQVYFDEARVIMASGTDGVTVVSAPNENTFSSVTATFQTDGIQAGDVLIVENPAGPPTPNLVLTVLAVDSETVLRVTSNFTAAAISLDWRVERELADQLVDSAYINEPVFRASNEIEILGGVQFTVGATARTVSYAKVYVEYRAYRTDLQGIDTVESTDDIENKVGRIDARNPLAAGLFVAKQNAGTAPVQFYGIETDDLVGYTKAKDAVSSDTSVYAIVPMSTDLAVHAMFKADNVSQADPLQALNTGVPQKFRVVIGSTELPETEDVVAETTTGSTEPLAGSIPPGIKSITLIGLNALVNGLKPADQLILSASENVASFDGTYTIAHINSATNVELNEALPVELLGVAEGVNYTVYRPSTNATVVPLVDNRATLTDDDVVYTSLTAGLISGGRTIAKVQDGTTPNGIHSIVEVAGASTIINGDFGSGNILAQEIVDALTDGTGVTITFSGSINLVATTTVPATVQAAAIAVAINTGTPGVDGLDDAALLDAVYIRFFDSAATFMTDGVLPGDIIELPENPNGVFGSTVKRYEVDQVVSEQRLQISNIVSGSYVNNTATVENELPHLDNRLGLGPVLGAVTQTSIRYRVVRELTTTQQVTELVSRAQSLNSRRALIAWPNSVDVSGLVDNSLPANPDGSEAAAAAQPGYYLSCAVGGMTAGLPSHQGFSRIGIAGISRIYNANDLFSESQLTDLSDGGLYVFMQNTPSSLPYSIHQLTTDPSTLESGEYSIVKNFDFVSLFFLDILEPFLGQWNINNDTLGFMRQALNTGIENLKLRRVAKIGAPLNTATITSIAVSDASADRVEIYMDVDLPKPLNVIGLHLVA